MKALDRYIAGVQRELSLIIVLGFFALVVLRSIGWLSMDFDMKEIVMLVVTFWFMRNRPPSGAEPDSEDPPASSSSKVKTFRIGG